jgi:tetratricopeptide (TPR) repeat protein
MASSKALPIQQAIEKDPGYALAYAGVADSYAVRNGGLLGLTGNQARPKAKAAALKALELDNSLAEAHTTLADTYLYYEWDFTKADQEFRRAIAANPNYPTAHQWYSECLYSMGRFDEAIAEAKRAQELDPISPIITGALGGALLYSGRIDEAIEQYKKALQMDPDIDLVRQDMAYAYAQKKMYPESVAEWQAALVLYGQPALAASSGEPFRNSGFDVFLRNVLDSLSKNSLEGEHAYEAAKILTLLGRKKEAVSALQKAFNAHEGQMVYLKCDTVLDPLRSEPDFQALIKKMNFPQ